MSNLSDLPNDLQLEIVSWIQPLDHYEWYFFMIELPSLSKTWYQMLRESQTGNYLYKNIYQFLFGWNHNNDLTPNQLLQKVRSSLDGRFSQVDDQNEEIGIWYKILKYSIIFYRQLCFDLNMEKSEKTHEYHAERTLMKNDLVAVKNVVGSDILLVNRPLFFQSGSYYFEMICEKDRSSSDNVFVGLVVGLAPGASEEIKTKYNHIMRSYLGSDDFSFGYYFANGDIYCGGNVCNKSFGSSVAVGDKIGVYVDMDKMMVRFSQNGLAYDPLSIEKLFTRHRFPELYDQKSQVVLFPAVSMLYDGDVMRLMGFEPVSFQKCNTILKDYKIN